MTAVSATTNHSQKRVDKAVFLLRAIGELPDPQAALLLLRHCASFGKLVHQTRLVPPSHHANALRDFDTAVSECVESVLCCSFDTNDRSLASLSTRLGGLGLRKAELHSPAAFFA